jgi:hypothetical protein
MSHSSTATIATTPAEGLLAIDCPRLTQRYLGASLNRERLGNP